MKKLYISFIGIMLLALSPVEAQQSNPKYKSITDTSVVKYYMGGIYKNGILTLYATAKYDSLDADAKQETLKEFAKEFSNCQIVVNTPNNCREMWLYRNGQMECIDKWDASKLDIVDYLPNKRASGGWFYSIGGTYSGSKELSRGTLNFRGGTFLYKTVWDIAATFNIGYSKIYEESLKTSDIGIDTRAYLPFRIKEINLAPYAGTGISWLFSPSSYFEWRLLAGGCWFLGPGSLDFGLQYGTKTGSTFTVGYTFRPGMLNSNKKK